MIIFRRLLQCPASSVGRTRDSRSRGCGFEPHDERIFFSSFSFLLLLFYGIDSPSWQKEDTLNQLTFLFGWIHTTHPNRNIVVRLAVKGGHSINITGSICEKIFIFLKQSHYYKSFLISFFNNNFEISSKELLRFNVLCMKYLP